jgi:hypothetical protein
VKHSIEVSRILSELFPNQTSSPPVAESDTPSELDDNSDLENADVDDTDEENRQA